MDDIIKICVILLLISIAGCADTYQQYGKHSWSTPGAMFMRNLPQGHDSYSQGFRDGCNSASGTVGSAMLRNHEPALDSNRGIEDRQYYLGYNTGWNYCTYYITSGPL